MILKKLESLFFFSLSSCLSLVKRIDVAANGLGAVLSSTGPSQCEYCLPTEISSRYLLTSRDYSNLKILFEKYVSEEKCLGRDALLDMFNKLEVPSSDYLIDTLLFRNENDCADLKRVASLVQMLYGFEECIGCVHKPPYNIENLKKVPGFEWCMGNVQKKTDKSDSRHSTNNEMPLDITQAFIKVILNCGALNM